MIFKIITINSSNMILLGINIKKIINKILFQQILTILMKMNIMEYLWKIYNNFIQNC
jgi:hypothetical protein